MARLNNNEFMNANDAQYQAVRRQLVAFLNSSLTEASYDKFFKNSVETALSETHFPRNFWSEATLDSLISEAGNTSGEMHVFPVWTERLQAVCRLGKPRMPQTSGSMDEEKQLSELASRLSGVLAAGDAPFSIQVLRWKQEEAFHSAIAMDAEDEKVLQSMIRSVYGYVETDGVEIPAASIPEEDEVYGQITVPYYDRNEEEDKYSLISWLSAVGNALPLVGFCQLSLQFLPLVKEQQKAVLEERYTKLCALRDRIQFLSEADWNYSSSVGANLSFSPAMGNPMEKFKEMVYDNRGRSASLNDSFGETRHEKSKRAEMFLQQLDQELVRLKRALTTRAWIVWIRLRAARGDSTTMKVIQNTFSGVLKQMRYELTWTKERKPAFLTDTRSMTPLTLFPAHEMIGLEFVTQEEFSLQSPGSAGKDLPIGRILWNGTETNVFHLPINALNRHAFVCGMTGGGKTNTVFCLMERFEKPFLVIEPVKGEYRGLQKAHRDLEIYSTHVGNDSQNIHLLRINPFWFPQGASLAAHIDSIKTVIASAFEMSAAMPNILEQCLYNVYISFGWNLITNKNIHAGRLPEELLYPTFSDLLVEIDAYLVKAGFGEEVTGNYRGAMSSRIRSFISGIKGVLLNTTEHPDYEKLSHGRVVIELEGLADDADKCLVMGTILVQYFEHMKATFRNPDHTLQHILIIEEAHRLFKNVPQQSGNTEGANVVGELVETLNNIMAEIRAFGEGMIIVDQSPSKVSADVIKNSGTKIIHRIDNREDCQLLQSALLMHEDDRSLPFLRLGEALIRTEGMIRPAKVKIFRAESEDAYSLSDTFFMSDSVRPELEYEFLTSSILSDETTEKEIRLLAMELIYRLSLSNKAENWNRCLSKTIDLVRKNVLAAANADGFAEDNDALIRFIIASAVRREKQYNGTKIAMSDRCMIQFILERALQLYQDAKEGSPVKPAEWSVLHYTLCHRLSHVIEMLDRSIRQQTETS